ncbi:terminase small subunit [Oceanospirillum beijerinckii]|uniref:terminase small subunit n=1 Tax=Oceanospirillum beijerinckii TaxID=64976 RepID=UPI0003F5AEDE|nr:terminase small subunit [Oceanospirillum beijerinckii]
MDVNKKQLAEIFGISERTFTEYQRHPNFPIKDDAGRGKTNTYDTVAVFKWLVRKEAGKNTETAKERLDSIRANREELAYAKDLEELVPADLVEERLTNVVIAIRSDLLNGNAQLKAELDTEYDTDIDVDILHDHSRQILEGLSEISLESESGAGTGAEEVCTATEDEQCGMGE